MVQAVSKKISELDDAPVQTAPIYVPATEGTGDDAATYKWLVSDLLGKVFNIRSFGAVGDGVTDDSAAIQRAVDAAGLLGGGIVYGPPGDYVCQTILIPSRVTLESDRDCVYILKASSSTYIVRLNGDDSHIRGGRFNGNSPNQSGQLIPVQVNASRCTVTDIKVYDSPWDAVGAFDASTDCLFERIWVYKVSAALAAGRVGINAALNGMTYRHTIRNCWVRDTNDWGVGGLATTTDLLVEGCHCYDTGGDCVTGYAAGNIRITVRNCIGINNGNHGTHLGGSDVTIEGCTFYNSTLDGILVQSDPNAQPTYTDRCTVVGNHVIGAKNNGIEITSYRNVVCSSNNVALDGTNIAHGYLLEDLDGASITGNVCDGSANRGFNLLGVTRFTFGDNSLTDNVSHGLILQDYTRPVVGTVVACGTGVFSNCSIQGNGGDGVRISSGSNFELTGMMVKANAVNLRTDGTAASVRVFGGDYTGNTSDTPVLTAGTVTAWTGALSGGTVNLASAATVALAEWTDYFRVTGTTNITTINGGWVGRRITLRFTGILTMTTSGNKVIGGGTFTSAANGTLTLIFDGTNWYETGRMSP